MQHRNFGAAPKQTRSASHGIHHLMPLNPQPGSLIETLCALPEDDWTKGDFGTLNEADTDCPACVDILDAWR